VLIRRLRAAVALARSLFDGLLGCQLGTSSSAASILPHVSNTFVSFPLPFFSDTAKLETLVARPAGSATWLCYLPESCLLFHGQRILDVNDAILPDEHSSARWLNLRLNGDGRLCWRSSSGVRRLWSIGPWAEKLCRFSALASSASALMRRVLVYGALPVASRRHGKLAGIWSGDRTHPKFVLCVWVVYYKQIRKSELRTPLHLLTADHVPQPRTVLFRLGVGAEGEGKPEKETTAGTPSLSSN
jgi:hypothetical protein